jgi:hypothetical protein
MFFTKETMEDGYVEKICSLFEESTPIFRIRAVLNQDGKYGLTIRDFQTGAIMDDFIFVSKSWYEVLYVGQDRCEIILQENSKVLEGNVIEF